MDVYEGIVQGLKESLAYERGEIELLHRTIGHCPWCGHHINFNEEGVSYCPLCDKEIRIEVKTDGMECVLPQLEQPED